MQGRGLTHTPLTNSWTMSWRMYVLSGATSWTNKPEDKTSIMDQPLLTANEWLIPLTTTEKATWCWMQQKMASCCWPELKCPPFYHPELMLKTGNRETYYSLLVLSFPTILEYWVRRSFLIMLKMHQSHQKHDRGQSWNPFPNFCSTVCKKNQNNHWT